MVRKKIMLPILGAALVGTSVFGANYVKAQDTTDPASSIIQKIAQKFNLQETDVKAVFEEERNNREAVRKAEMEQSLTKAVTDGKITASQKTAILEKFQNRENMRPYKEAFKAMTAAQRQAEMEKKKSEMDSWLSQNGLTHETLHEVLGGKGFGGGKFMMKIHKSTQGSPVPTQ